MSYGLQWATADTAGDIGRLPADLSREGLTDRAKIAVVHLARGDHDKQLIGQTFPALAGMLEVKFDLDPQHRSRRPTMGQRPHGPRFRIIAELDADIEQVAIWAIGPKDPRAFAGQHLSAFDLAERRLLCARPDLWNEASASARRRRAARSRR
ncbi:hypothetical protein GKE82_23700 [Conexibacter sp. W3-3-2]|uniref:hypothetical protein n=1 Tax=Conexibacter sp. W3-3-2 TaxID=2675227 RepID=UPI0012BA040C|nr:hypothetical protein [Conexibacter sp. W3-3-2]MTD47211.1 hypothetical protein [Conexibacter sp. W3-3-2]